MSIQINWQIVGNNGKTITPSSVTLSDPTGAYGVRRLDTLATVVAAGTAMAEGQNNTWSLQFTEPKANLQYEYYVRVEEDTPVNNVFYVRGTITGSTDAFLPHTLGWCRKMLVDLTRRWDLVADPENGDYTDLGFANWYLNSAQQRLDNLLDYPKSTAWLYKEVAADESMISFQQCRYVRNVYEVLSDNVTRVPVSWATIKVGLAPEQRDAVAVAGEGEPDPNEVVIDWTNNIIFGDHYLYHAIYIVPTDRDRNIIVEADWYTRHLTDDTDKSFWTVQHPQLLIRAAQREMEVDMRNSQGVNDFDAPLLADVKNIYRNLVAEEMAGPPEFWRMD